MGCESQIKESNIIQQLLKNDLCELSVSRDKLSWLYNNDSFPIDNSTLKSTQKSSNKSNGGRHQNSSKYFFGYKSNNKVNNFQFRFFENKESYMEQYRRENKTIPCLERELCKDFRHSRKSRNKSPLEMEETDGIIQSVSSDLEPIYDNPYKIVTTATTAADPVPSSSSPEKSIIHQIRFWQKQNASSPLSSSNLDELRNLEGPQIVASLRNQHPNLANFSSSNKLSVHNKRSLDVLIPQGTTYDILTEEGRLNGNNPETEKVKFQDLFNQKKYQAPQDSLGVVKYQTNLTREPSQIRRLGRDNGTLEFARLLDERLRTLCEQEQRYQKTPSQKLLRSPTTIIGDERRLSYLKSNNKKPNKSFVRTQSASTLSNLTVSGIATNNNQINKVFNSHNSSHTNKNPDDKTKPPIPCYLPQMPAFGIQYFPKCIIGTNSTESHSIYKPKYSNKHQHPEEE